MKIQRGHRVELDPNNHQRSVLASHAGTARFIWNWARAMRQKQYHEDKHLPVEQRRKLWNAFSQKVQWNKEKHTVAPWWKDVSSKVAMGVLRNLDAAYKRFFEYLEKKKAGVKGLRKVGPPKAKKKKHGRSFWLTNEGVRFVGHRLVLPKIGSVRVKHVPVLSGRIVSVTVSEKAGRWFASILVECEQTPSVLPSGARVGVDLGLSSFAVVSDGRRYQAPKPLKAALRKLRIAQRRASRCIEGSKRWRKAQRRVAVLHWRVANQRGDFLHKLTTKLAKAKSVIVVEKLNVQGMMKNRHLARAISDVGWYEFRRQLQYKCSWYGGELVVADSKFASTKTCSRCGQKKKEMALSERVFRCDHCGYVEDRDVNASYNLRDYGTADRAETAGGNTGNARGGAGMSSRNLATTALS